MNARLRATTLGVGAILLLAGCSSVEPAPDTSGGTDQAPDPAACVPDPAAVVQAPAQNRDQPLPDDLTARIDAAVQGAFADTGAPGAIVGVSSPEGTWIAAYGSADAETNQAMTPSTHTRVGSITKTLTGTAAIQLAQDGLIAMDDTIGQYRDGIPNGDDVTLLMLANMTSGIASYTMQDEFADALYSDPSRTFTIDELIQIGVDASPSFAPGEGFEYSNTNTLLLGEVIEQVTGKPLGTVLEEQVIAPLGLEHTSWPGDTPEMPEPYAHGQTAQGLDADGVHDATRWNPSWAGGAGKIISTVDDLLVYGHALATGQGLLDAETAAWRLGTFPEGPLGYGAGFACFGGWVGHEGSMPGYNTQLVYDTGSATTVAVAVNSDVTAGSCEADSDGEGLEDPRCLTPASRILIPVSKVLGNEFTPPGA